MLDQYDDIVLGVMDNPENFVNFLHNEDLQEVSVRQDLTIIEHSLSGHHRTFIRLWLRLPNGNFLPVSFLCDSGAPGPLYLGKPTIDALKAKGLLVDGGNGYDIIRLSFANGPTDHAIPIQPTPPNHAPANIIGLPLIKKMRVHFDDVTTIVNPPV